jgi:chloride channel 7
MQTRLMHCKTLVCKMAGLVFAMSAWLPVGKEGPMVHAGAIVAAGISQGTLAQICGLGTTFNQFQDFCSDSEQRYCVVCSTAAGVAAAFGVPIGGVLLSLDEGASFWSTKLTGRVLVYTLV